MLTNADKTLQTTDLQKDEIQFYDNFFPALPSGNYVIEVEQHLEDDGFSQTFKRSQDFTVTGNRFSLNFDEVHSMYPPMDGQGDFDTILPQVILNNRTLPWENSDDGRTPLLAVLLFEAAELMVEDWSKVSRTGAKSVKISTLKKPEAGFATPDLSDFLDEEEDDTCLCIEISADYFNEIVPRFEELPYLSHVRAINADNKTSDNVNTWFSTVFANRFPKSQSRNIVHLVSLEGFTDYLKPRSIELEADLKVRLVSLASWEFYCESPKEEFDVLAQQLIENHEMLRLNLTQHIDNEIIKTSLEGGYIPLPYETRHGEKTTAWYRGPLTPVIVKNQHFPPNFSAESAMIYDKNTGLFDTSYAVAWQTGRLLALSDAYFSKTLLTWKRHANVFLDMFFAKQNFYKNIILIYNENCEHDNDKILTLEDLMSDKMTSKLLTSTLQQSLSNLGFLSRGDLGEKRTIEELIDKAKEELTGLAGILSEKEFENIKEAADVNLALVEAMF